MNYMERFRLDGRQALVTGGARGIGLATAEALGSLHGSARFNQGVALQQQKKHAQALTTFAEAEKQGFSGQSLHYHRGESAFALGQFALAFDSFSQGLTSVTEGVTGNEMDRVREAMRMRRAEAAIGAGVTTILFLVVISRTRRMEK